MWEGALTFGIRAAQVRCSLKRSGLCTFVPLLGLGWENASAIKNLLEDVLPTWMQNERDKG